MLSKIQFKNSIDHFDKGNPNSFQRELRACIIFENICVFVNIMRCNTFCNILITHKLLLWKVYKNAQFPYSFEQISQKNKNKKKMGISAIFSWQEIGQNVCILSKYIILNTHWHKVLDHLKTLNTAGVWIFVTSQVF